jgi:hypothetical protein
MALAGGGAFRLETSGWHVTSHDGVISPAVPTSPSGAGGGGGGWAAVGGGGRRDLRSESATRIMVVEDGRAW